MPKLSLGLRRQLEALHPDKLVDALRVGQGAVTGTGGCKIFIDLLGTFDFINYLSFHISDKNNDHPTAISSFFCP